MAYVCCVLALEVNPSWMRDMPKLRIQGFRRICFDGVTQRGTDAPVFNQAHLFSFIDLTKNPTWNLGPSSSSHPLIETKII